MGILPDWMIRQLKIAPMAEGLKRDGVISYGVSSYGYDLRAGYEWKVFTNVWGSTVDPKKFDERAFVCVDLTPEGHSWQLATAHGGTPAQQCARCGAWDTTPSALRICSTKQNYVLIPPNSFALCSSVERVEVPRDCLALVIGKSTYARCGIVLNCTPLEPEWRGHVTLEVSNTTPLPAKVYAGEGIGQVLFFHVDHTATLAAFLAATLSSGGRAEMEKLLKEDQCKESYADKQGKYQDQIGGPQLPKVD